MVVRAPIHTTAGPAQRKVIDELVELGYFEYSSASKRFLIYCYS